MGETARVPGVDVARGEKILGSLAAERLIRPEDVRPASLATLADLAAVHSEAYLARTAEATHLGHIFGLEAHDVDVDPVLISQRRQVGGTIEAARWAAKIASRVAFNVGGGFHHAEPELGGGFCVYNDVAIAIASLRAGGFDAPIAIVDLDFHQGDGNITTFANDETVFTYSIHGSIWSHAEAVADEQHLLPSGTTDEAYLEKLADTLPTTLSRVRPRLIFYIAGNDVLAGDRLGELALTRAGVLARDRSVIEMARERMCSVAVTLGGGYSDDAWRATADFVRWLLTDEVHVTEKPVRDTGRRYAEIARQLDPADLTRSDDDLDFGLTEADLMGDLTGPRSHSRLLDFYSRHGVELAMERYGISDEVRARGFHDIRLELDPSDPQWQRLAAYATKHDEEHLLVDMVLRRVTRPAPEGLSPNDALQLLYIEWMLLQNPTEDFSLRQPPWPGQSHPGLGIGEKIMLMLFQGAQRLGLDGLAHHPSRYHIAFIGGERSRFLDPAIQGRFEAIREAFADMDLADAAWKMENEELRWSDGEPVEWTPEDMVVPASERFETYLSSDHYLAPCAEAREGARKRGFVVK
jgi:acetoin utilization deacetylase AcuC-like enzyme